MFFSGHTRALCHRKRTFVLLGLLFFAGVLSEDVLGQYVEEVRLRYQDSGDRYKTYEEGETMNLGILIPTDDFTGEIVPLVMTPETVKDNFDLPDPFQVSITQLTEERVLWLTFYFSKGFLSLPITGDEDLCDEEGTIKLGSPLPTTADPDESSLDFVIDEGGNRPAPEITVTRGASEDSPIVVNEGEESSFIVSLESDPCSSLIVEGFSNEKVKFIGLVNGTWEISHGDYTRNPPSRIIRFRAREDDDDRDDLVELELLSVPGPDASEDINTDYHFERASVWIKIIDNDRAPIQVSIDPDERIVTEGEELAFVVKASRSSTDPATIPLEVAPETVKTRLDLPAPFEVTLAPNETETNIPIGTNVLPGLSCDEEGTITFGSLPDGFTEGDPSVAKFVILETDQAGRRDEAEILIDRGLTEELPIEVPAGGKGHFFVWLKSDPCGDVGVDLANQHPGPIKPPPGESYKKFFSSADWGDMQRVNFEVNPAQPPGPITILLRSEKEGDHNDHYDGKETLVYLKVTTPDTDPPRVTISGLPGSISNTNALTATFTFGEDVTGFETDDVTVDGGTKGTFTANSGTEYTLVITPAGNADVTVTVAANAATDDAGNDGPASAVTATVVWVDPTEPTVFWTSPAQSVEEDAGSVTLTAELSSAASGNQTISLTYSGTATLGDDYTRAATLTIQAGETEGSINIPITDDGDPEPDETIIVTLDPPSGIDLGSPSAHTITINANDADDDDDSPPTVTLTASPEEVVEGGAIAVTVTLSEPLPNAVAIDLTYSDATTEPGDYTPVEQITVPAGALTETANLETVDDDIAESTETFTLALGDLPVGLSPGDPSSVELTILDDGDIPPPAEVSLSVDPTAVDEGGAVTVELTLSEVLTSDVVVPLTYSPDGTAEPEDYVPLEEVTISSGESAGTGQIITARDEDTDDETFIVALGALPPELSPGRETSQTVTIRDVYPTQVQLSASPNPADEGEVVTLTVALTQALADHVTIPLLLTPGTADAQDYRAPSPARVEIEAGDTEGAYQVSIVQDDVAEGDETFMVAFGALPDEVVAEDPAEVEVTITDDDVTGIDVSPSVSVTEGGAGAFSFSLTSKPLEAVTVTLTGHSGTDLTPSPLSYRFTPEDWNRSQQVTLAAAEDDDFANDEVQLTLAANGGSYTGVTERVIVTITDNDAPGIEARALVVVLEGGTKDLSVALATRPSGGDVTVTFPLTRGDLMLVPTRPLVFSPDDWNVPQSITLSAKQDDDFVDDHAEVTLTANGGGYVGVTRQVKVTITDDDGPKIVTDAEVTMDEGTTYPLAVRLSAEPSGSVQVAFTGHAGTVLALNRDLLTFTPTNWNSPQVVTLTAAEDDQDFEEDRVNLLLTASGGGYDNVTHRTRVTIADNDVPVGPLSLSIYDQREPEDAGTLHLPVELSRKTDKTVTVRYATTDVEAEGGADYTQSRGIVIFAPGATRGTIIIDLTDDNILEEAERFNVTLSSPQNARIARGTGTGTILDNDGGAHLWLDDAIASEDEREIRFRVMLSQPQLQMVSATYQTRDGTAKAGEDYEASSGVVILPPGTTEALITVPLLSNRFDWGEENFSVILVSSREAEITKKVGVATIQEATAIEDEVLEAYAARFVRTYSSQLVEALSERMRLDRMVSACGAGARAEMAQLWYAASAWDPSLGELLAGCKISMTAPGGGFSLWGQGAFRRFNGRGEEVLTLDGEVTTGMVGVDYRWRQVLAGVLLGHSQGDGSFEVAQQQGAVTAGLTGIYPYVSYVQPGGELWVSGGIGWGQAEILALEGDLVSRFGAMGVRQSLVQTRVLGLSYHGDVLITDADIADRAVSAGVYRFRAGVEADARISETLRPYVVANVRQDGGDAEAGTGLEFGGGIRVAYPAWRLRGQVHTQGLVMHTSDSFSEWGFSGLLQVGTESEGLMMRLRPSWGRGQAMRMVHQQTILDAVPLGSRAHRTELELGYGIPWEEGVVRPMMGLTQMQNSTIYRLGGELRPWQQVSVSLYGLAHGRNTAIQDIGVNLRGLLQY